MQSASQRFNDDQRQRIGAAVGEAEGKTSAEIIPVVATSSGRYDRGEDIVGLWLGLILAAVAWNVYPLPETQPGSWSGPAPVMQLLVMLAAVVIGFLIGAFLASKGTALRRLFTARSEMRDEVQTRARAMFFDHRVHHTEGSTGLLIYVSLMERLATVVADESVQEKVGADVIAALCEELTAGLRSGDITEAVCATIRSAGEKLAAVLPREAGDVNELPDALVTVD